VLNGLYLLYTSQNLLGTIFRVTFTVFYRRIWNIVGKYSILCCDKFKGLIPSILSPPLPYLTSFHRVRAISRVSSSCVYSQCTMRTTVGPCAKGHFIHTGPIIGPGVLFFLLLLQRAKQGSLALYCNSGTPLQFLYNIVVY
jgi:hypothetical protein